MLGLPQIYYKRKVEYTEKEEGDQTKTSSRINKHVIRHP